MPLSATSPLNLRNFLAALALMMVLGTLLAWAAPVLGTTSIVAAGPSGAGGAGSGSVWLATTGSWTASSNATWLHLQAGSTSGSGNQLIVFNYDANPAFNSRTGTITIAGLTLTVSQPGAGYGFILPSATVVSGLNSPYGVALDNQGNVYIADTLNNAIKEWNQATKVLTILLQTGLNNPQGVAVDSAGNVYIADTGNNAIKKWSAATHSVTSLAAGLNTPTALALDAAGNVYFADTGNNAIKVWNATTSMVTNVVPNGSGLKIPQGLAVDVAGNLYIADTGNNVVYFYNINAPPATALVSAGLNGPTGLAVDGQGRVYIADTGNNTVKRWSPTEPVLPVGSFTSPAGVAADPSGDFYTAAKGSNTISQVDAFGYVGPGTKTETPQAGSDSVEVLPSTEPLLAPPSSDQPWLTINGTTGNIISFAFTANTSASSRTGHITVGGGQITVNQNGVAAPAVVSVTPVNGSGSPQTFSATYQDPSGAGNLNAVYLILNSTLSTAHGCAMLYVPSTNGLYLYNDAGSGFITGNISPGSAGTLSNSQCTIANAGATTTSGLNITVPVAVTFSSAFSGTKNLYAVAANNEGLYSNWFNAGTWAGAPSQPPSFVSVAPINSNGMTQTFNASFAEPNGVSDLGEIYVLFNPTLSAAHGCLALYLPSSNAMYLYNDAGNGFIPGTVSPGTAGTLSNGQCTIGNAGAVTVSGTQLTLPVAITFTASFSGVKNVYAFAGNFENAYSSIAPVGTWTPAPSQAPTVVSVSPINGSGSPTTFSATFSEQNGVSDVSAEYLLFNTSISPANGCLLVYQPVGNLLYLYNDMGSGLVAGTINPGSAGTLANAQCTISNAGPATVAGISVTLPVTITFGAGFTGSKNVYGYITNFEGGGSGWQTVGTWGPH